MSQVIRITDALYKRLEAHTVGFDTPSNVIERILDAYEGVTKSEHSSHSTEPKDSPNSLEIIYHPATEEAFKTEFLKTKKAHIKIYYTDGEKEVKEWDSPKFTVTSRVAGNLRSGYLRNWKEKGIYKAEVSIDESEGA